MVRKVTIAVFIAVFRFDPVAQATMFVVVNTSFFVLVEFCRPLAARPSRLLKGYDVLHTAERVSNLVLIGGSCATLAAAANQVLDADAPDRLQVEAAVALVVVPVFAAWGTAMAAWLRWECGSGGTAVRPVQEAFLQTGREVNATIVELPADYDRAGAEEIVEVGEGAHGGQGAISAVVVVLSGSESGGEGEGGGGERGGEGGGGGGGGVDGTFADVELVERREQSVGAAL